MLLDQRGTSLREVTVILNEHAGRIANPELPGRIEAAFRAGGWRAQVVISGKSARPDRLAKAAISQGDQILIAAGGDGTISAVAASLVGTSAVLGVLPLGTLNHFPKGLRIPLDLEAASQVIQRGKIANVDAGEVNGRIFVNNSSLGLYPSMVFERDL